MPDYPDAWPEPGVMHWRLEADRLGTLDLTCDAGYVVERYDLGSPTVREVAVNNSLDNGTYDLTRFYGSRAITLDIALKPHSGIGPQTPPTAPEAMLRDRLLAFTYPGVRPRVLFSEQDDPRVKQALLRGAQSSVAVDRRYYNKMNVSWVVPRGAFWSWQERCHRYTFSTGTPHTQTQQIENAGSAPAHWRAELLGEAIKPRFILGSDVILELDYVSNPGDVVVVESFSRTVSINGQPIGFKYVGDNSVWFLIPPGLSSLTIEIDSPILTGYPYATWQPDSNLTFWADTAPPPGGNPPNNPPPLGRPPWAWSTRIDPGTGLPGWLDLDFCFYDTYM